jgi:hypothetical protein
VSFVVALLFLCVDLYKRERVDGMFACNNFAQQDV